MGTTLGHLLKEIRRMEGERMLDMASKLDVSPAFLSAVEHGRKAPPKNWAIRLEKRYKLSDRQKRSIHLAVDAATNGTVVRTNSKLAKDTAAVFARRVNRLSETKLNAIRHLIEKD